MSFNTGENVGSYRVMEKLGRGGMATVYKAYHANLDRYVALKVLHPAFLEDPNFLARFQREARLVAKLEHQNIVPVYDFAEHEEQPYLVMKYVEGETLKALLNRGRLDADMIWEVVNAVGAGLDHAHNEGILHRDIKPSNVIVGNDGKIYLADFGLARIAELGESTLSGDMIMGTPQYISPEQAKGEKDLDNRTDIYSFAVMLYEMVVGQVPFSADTPFSIIHDHIYSPLPLPKTVNPSIPDEVERVLLKALAKERDDRYQNVSELIQAFKDAWKEAEVDMAQVTMTSPIEDVKAATAPAPQPASVSPTPVPSPTDAATVTQDEAKEEKPKKKKRKIWLYILGGIIIICICILAIGVISDRRAANTDPAAPLAGSNERDPQELADLRSWVNESPDDPYAHLELAMALYDNQQPKIASDELRQAIKLAGDDTDFYYDAGWRLMDRESWNGAAAVFMRALQIIPPDQMDDRFVFEELFRESLYKAALKPGVFEMLPKDDILRQDEPMLRVAEARQTFYHGQREDAWRILEELKAFKPGMQEAMLLEAEMLMRDRRGPEAIPLLEALDENDITSEWIRVEAEKYLDEIHK